MAVPVRAKTYKGALCAIFFEDPANAGKFLRPCALTQHNMSFTKEMGEQPVPYCDDPDLPAWVERETNSFDFSGSGSGTLAEQAVDRLWAMYSSGNSVNARIYLGKPDNIEIGRYWEGRLHVSQLDITGNRGERAQVTINVASDGELVFKKTTANA